MDNPLIQHFSALAASVATESRSFAGDAGEPKMAVKTIVPFVTGGMGNFPYYYQDPLNLQFNINTYNWINTNLANNIPPIRQGSGLYTNYFLSAISKITYVLSQNDQQNFHQIRTNASEQQLKLPTEDEGRVGGAVSLMDEVTTNNNYLRQALTSLQNPSLQNGGLQANNGLIYPAYQFDQSMDEILAGLNSDANSFVTNIVVTKLANGQVNAQIENGPVFQTTADDLLRIELDSDPNYFASVIKAGEPPITLQISFSGVMLVNFGPVHFNPQNGQSWYWPEAIFNAVANGTKDVTGFKFLPDPGIDFSGNGPFGFPCGLVISNHPTIELSAVHLDTNILQHHLDNSTNATVSLLNNPVALSENPIKITNNANFDAAGSSSPSATISPLIPDIVSPAIDSIAWVHGVQTNFL